MAIFLAVVRSVDAFTYASTRPPAASLQPQVCRPPVLNMNAATPDKVSAALETAKSRDVISNAIRLHDVPLCIRMQSRHSSVSTSSM